MWGSASSSTSATQGFREASLDLVLALALEPALKAWKVYDRYTSRIEIKRSVPCICTPRAAGRSRAMEIGASEGQFMSLEEWIE